MITREREVAVYENPYLRVFFDEVRFPGGAAGRYTRVRDAQEFPGVVVLPYRDGQVGLVRQFRYAVGQDLWEAPRGCGESHDTQAEARRELVEETGAEDVVLHDLGLLHPNSGLLDSTAHLFLGVLPAEARFAAVDEVEAARWVPVADVLGMVADGQITDGFTIAAVSRAHLRGLLTGA